MSDDIVKRLRNWPDEPINNVAMLREAADEIDRLRNMLNACGERNARLQPEVERLRLALLAIANYPHGGTEAQLMRVYARTTLHWRVE